MKTIQAICVTLLVLAGATASAAHNVSGRITCGGQGVAGVAVSDGYEVVLTDVGGYYEMTSGKHNGYVFYTLPRGYEPELSDGFAPQFWAALDTSDTAVSEVHDFTLSRVDNDRHIVLFGADTHLARRYSDRALFKKGFIATLGEEVERAGDTPVYSVVLGDLTWDVFWYQNDYDLTDFVGDMRHFDYPVPLWPVIGNHDHDPAALPWNNTDWESAGLWRTTMGPNYYSFNLGKVHYVVLDDIVYKNEPRPGEDYAEGVMGSRNYLASITAEQLSWLDKDLALVSNNTPVVICLHIPVWGVTSTFGYQTRLYNSTALCDKLTRFDDVYIMSGHTHTNYTACPPAYPNIIEHCIAASSGSLWLTGALTGHHICQDGSPAGFLRWTASGDDVSWQYKPLHEGESQMRVYDMNTVSKFYRTNSTMRAILNEYPTRVDFADIDSNMVMVNVYAYDPAWRVEICEGDSLLECRRVYTEDPFHTLAYDVAQYSATGYYSTSYTTTLSTHLFEARAATSTRPVIVRVIDSFGNIYLKSIQRPHGYNLSMERQERDLLAGDVNMDDEVNIADVNLLIDAMIGNNSSSCPQVLLDCNGDNELNLADINTIVSLILSR